MGKGHKKARDEVVDPLAAVDEEMVTPSQNSTTEVAVGGALAVDGEEKSAGDMDDWDLPEMEKVDSCDVYDELRSLTAKMYEIGRELAVKVDVKYLDKVTELSAEYGKLVRMAVLQNERLKGRLDVLTSKAVQVRLSAATVAPSVAAPMVSRPVVPVAVPAVAAPVAVSASVACPVAVVPKPVETWSVVVRTKKKNSKSSEDVVKKVVEQVGPTLGVRVHEIKPIRGGGAVIRTPTVAEREKVVGNTKFDEAGLVVSVNEKAGPRVMINGVHSIISPEEFMSELFEMNLNEVMSAEKFKESVRLVSKPWSSDDADCVNVVVEGDEVAMRRLLEVGWVYIKWYGFRARLQDAIPHCFRCLGFDHRIRECRMREEICRRCGNGGHLASRCDSAVHCRNCALRSLPADHSMFSYCCPVYAALVARANARH